MTTCTLRSSTVIFTSWHVRSRAPTTEYTQSGNDHFLAYISSFQPPNTFTISNITYKVVVYVHSSWEGRYCTLPLFLLYPSMYSVAPNFPSPWLGGVGGGGAGPGSQEAMIQLLPLQSGLCLSSPQHPPWPSAQWVLQNKINQIGGRDALSYFVNRWSAQGADPPSSRRREGRYSSFEQVKYVSPLLPTIE